MDESVFPPEIILKIVSNKTPCEILKLFTLYYNFQGLVEIPSILRMIARQNDLPIANSVSKLCKYQNMNRVDLLIEAAIIGDSYFIGMSMPYIKRKLSEKDTRDIYVEALINKHDDIAIMIDSISEQYIRLAGLYNRPNVIIDFLNKYALDIYTVESIILRGSAHINIVKLLLNFIDKHNYDVSGKIYEEIMLEAARNGNCEIVKMMIVRGADNFENAMSYAMKNHQHNVVFLLIDMGFDNYNKLIVDAAEYGDIEIARIMLDMGANNYEEVMKIAAYRGNIEIVKMMIDNGTCNYEEVMEIASRSGYIEIVKLMVEMGATNFDQILLSSMYFSDMKPDIAKLLITQSNEDHTNMLRILIKNINNGYVYYRNRQYDVIELLIANGKFNVDEIMKFSVHYGYNEIIGMLIKYDR